MCLKNYDQDSRYWMCHLARLVLSCCSISHHLTCHFRNCKNVSSELVPHFLALIWIPNKLKPFEVIYTFWTLEHTHTVCLCQRELERDRERPRETKKERSRDHQKQREIERYRETLLVYQINSLTWFTLKYGLMSFSDFVFITTFWSAEWQNMTVHCTCFLYPLPLLKIISFLIVFLFISNFAFVFV